MRLAAHPGIHRDTGAAWLSSSADRELSFDTDHLPLYFFNDNGRFNYYRPDEPDRATLPFAARWQGWLDVPAAGEHSFWLTAIGVARLDVGGDWALQVDSGERRTAERVFKLPAGHQPIELAYLRRAGASAS